jgi:hypothetical protein
MNNWKLLVLALPLAAACGDKEIESEPSAEASSEPSAEASSEPGSEPSGEEVEPLEPVAIGFEFSGIWDEAGNDGAGELKPYLFPDLNNTNGGEPLILSEIVQVTLASTAYFSLGSDATDEQRENETCTVYAWFDNAPANLLADDFNWDTGVGGMETYSTDSWQGFEGMLIFNLDSASERCSQLAEGHSLDTFDGMHFGLIFGGLSSHMTSEFESTDWWADETDLQASYFTQYIAMNHPSADGGYTFIGYDWTSSIYVDADPEQCASYEYEDAEGNVVSEEVCGMVLTEEVEGQTNYALGDVYDVVNPRYGYVQGSAWWYEDYPNLDLDIMKDWNQ